MPRIEVRCSAAQKAAWEAKADRQGVTLAELCRAALDHADLPRRSRAAEQYRRVAELYVLVVQRLEAVRRALEAGEAPREVLLVYLTHVCALQRTIERFRKGPNQGDTGSGSSEGETGAGNPSSGNED